MGLLKLSAPVPDADMIHKNKFIPLEGASFEYNIKADIDNDFVTFFALQRGKIRPLAYSDIESQFQLIRQLMNIGKAFEVDGIGVFSKENNGTIHLKPGHYVVPVGDQLGNHGKLKERAPVSDKKEPEKERSTPKSMNAGARNLIIGIAVVLALMIGGWMAWSKWGSALTSDKPVKTSETDTVISVSPANSPTVSAAPSLPAIPKWKAYFRNFDSKAEALAKFKLYEGNTNPVVMETADSVHFKFYVFLDSEVADTTRKIDSMSKLYSRPVRLEKIP